MEKKVVLNADSQVTIVWSGAMKELPQAKKWCMARQSQEIWAPGYPNKHIWMEKSTHNHN